ncbi:MAG: MFS transporter [Candidatus Marinimicrobia bacterium]|nr:MFS transporter [bacterium]MCG2715211.1 MFS transporter [Candidatus Neomarinimicrobiota bacterium]
MHKAAPTEPRYLTEKSLKFSIRDGLFWSIMAGFGDSYLPAFAVFLNATTQQMGMLTALPQFMAALIQLFSVRVSHLFKSSKRAVLISVFLQASMWLVITVITYLTRNVWILIFLVMLYQSFGALPGPIWFAWMGNLVPEEKRGRYFGKRNRISGFFSFLSVIIAGIILDHLSKTHPLSAFGTIFIIAFASRMISLYYLFRQHEPPAPRTQENNLRLIDFIRNIRRSNFGLFTLFLSLVNFTVFIASPLMSLYWLRYLHFTYLQYMAVVSSASIASFVTMTFWGRHSDHYGNKTIMEVAGYLIAMLPLFWFLIRFIPAFLIFPLSVFVQILAGFAWAGFNLSSSNFIYDTIPSQKRIQMYSYFNFLKGIAVFIGGTLGGYLASFESASATVSPFNPNGIMLVLLVSAVSRLIIMILFLPKILEVRDTIPPRPHFLYFVTVMPFKGLVYELVTGVNRTLVRRNRKSVS